MLVDQQSKPGCHFDAKIAQPRALRRIRRRSPNPSQTKISEYRGGCIVITGVDRQPQPQIGIDGVEAAVLQRVRVQLGVQPDAASLVTAEVDHRAASFSGDLTQCRVQLFPAVAPP